MSGLFDFDDDEEIVCPDFNLKLNMRPVPKAAVAFDGKRRFLPQRTRQALHDVKLLSSKEKDRMYVDGIISEVGAPIFDCAVIVWLEYAFIRPKSVKPGKRLHPSVKPDIDNLTKLILDGLTPHILRDDCLVCEIHKKKIYSETEYVLIKIKELKPDDNFK